MGKEVISNRAQLIEATKSHYKVYKEHISKYTNISNQKSLFLLKFYAAECGIKALYLSKNNLRDTTFLLNHTGQKYGFSHDLERWVKELKIPVSVFSGLKITGEYTIGSLHERLRYGSSIKETDLKTQVAYLKVIFEVLKKNAII